MNDHVFAEFGPFFASETHAAGAPVDGPWSTLDAALANPQRIKGRVERVQTALGAGAASNVSLRVAASVTHLGLVARLLAPALAAGNCVVLKPAEQTPASILIVMEPIEDLLPPGHRCGDRRSGGGAQRL